MDANTAKCVREIRKLLPDADPSNPEGLNTIVSCLEGMSQYNLEARTYVLHSIMRRIPASLKPVVTISTRDDDIIEMLRHKRSVVDEKEWYSDISLFLTDDRGIHPCMSIRVEMCSFVSFLEPVYTTGAGIPAPPADTSRGVLENFVYYPVLLLFKDRGLSSNFVLTSILNRRVRTFPVTNTRWGCYYLKRDPRLFIFAHTAYSDRNLHRLLGGYDTHIDVHFGERYCEICGRFHFESESGSTPEPDLELFTEDESIALANRIMSQEQELESIAATAAAIRTVTTNVVLK